MIYDLSKQVPNVFMVSISSFKSSSRQHDVHFVIYDPILSKIEYKAGYVLEQGYVVTDKSFSVSLSSATQRAHETQIKLSN